MNQDEKLEKIREIIRESDRTGLVPDSIGVEDMLDAFKTLDEWLSDGGQLPKAWKR